MDILLIFLSSLLLKILLIFLFEDKVYPDVQRAIEFGKEYFANEGSNKVNGLVINSKTYVGPILWYFISNHIGVLGLKIINVVSFVLLFMIQYFLGRKVYPHNTLLIALFLFAFYVGTNLNVVAGEQDDVVAALFFTTGVLFYLNKKKVFLPSLLMGLGFLFKFSTGIFCIGFVIYLIIKHRWKSCLLSGLGIIIPFLCLNFIDLFNSLYALILSFGMQKNYSSWGQIVFKLFSTGMIFSLLASGWTFLRKKTDNSLLFFCLSSIYLPYVLLMRDAFAMSYVMMQCILFSSFLIADFLLNNEYFGKGTLRKVILCCILIFYLIITTFITYHNIFYDTLELKIG